MDYLNHATRRSRRIGGRAQAGKTLHAVVIANRTRLALHGWTGRDLNGRRTRRLKLGFLVLLDVHEAGDGAHRIEHARPAQVDAEVHVTEAR